MNFTEIVSMPLSAVDNYIRYLPAQQAKYKLLLADAFSMAQADNATRRRIYKEVQREADFGTAKSKALPTPGNLARIGIGMQFVVPN